MKKTSKISEQVENKKAAIYTRVSTRWQIDRDSLQFQRESLSSYCEMVLNIKDYEVFEDPGYSGKNTDRPNYQRMMDRLRTGEFSHVVVYKLDRISRNLLDFASMYSELKSLGVTFVSKNEQFDTSSAIGEAMLKIILVFAELERNMTSERVSAVMMSRANNGQWNGGRVPYGYSWDKESHTFSVIENEAAVVRKIYDLYETHQSVLYVARTLNDEGLLSRSGGEWNIASLHRILQSPFYAGVYRYNVHDDEKQKLKDEDEWIICENHHTPIITDVQFDRVQYILQRNWRGGYKRGETHLRSNIHIFSGMLKCGICGSNMSATLDKRRASGTRPSIYGCSTRRGNKSKCNNKYVSDMTIGPFVFNYLSNMLRAHKTMSASTSIVTLERKLLRGPAFEAVEHIDQDCLEAFRKLLLQGESGVEYRPISVFDSAESPSKMLERFIERKNQSESALNRLRSLYLYSESHMPESEYLIEQKRILDDIDDCDKRISEIKSKYPTLGETSDNFEDKASYFIMVSQLLKSDYVDYEKYIATLDASIPRGFLMAVLDSIELTDGRVTSIRFKNGMIHTFKYKR